MTSVKPRSNTAVSIRKVKSVGFNSLPLKETFILEDDAVDPRDGISVFIKLSEEAYREVGIVDPDEEINQGIRIERNPSELFVVLLEILEVAVTYREK